LLSRQEYSLITF